jgi:uncharacterized SAM-binding protein YcdF (DUF218 family)
MFMKEIFFNRLLGAFLLPPLVFLLPLIWCYARKKTYLFGLMCLLIYYSSTPDAAIRLNQAISPPPLGKKHTTQAQAIVILGGGKRPAPEYAFWGSAEGVNADTSTRVLYGIRLAQSLQLPVLVSGGNPTGGSEKEARLMADFMHIYGNIRPRWVEDASYTTEENAAFSADILKRLNINHIILVTHAYHMRRAQQAFERYEFNVTPAPTGYARYESSPLGRWIPQGRSMQEVYSAMREIVGMAWYNLRSSLYSEKHS